MGMLGGLSGIRSHALLSQADSKEIRIGIIGTGVRGIYLTERSLHHRGVKITAVCDIVEERAKRAQQVVEKAGAIARSLTLEGRKITNACWNEMTSMRS